VHVAYYDDHMAKFAVPYFMHRSTLLLPDER